MSATSNNDWIDVDFGAIAWGTWRGQILSAKAPPTKLAPAVFASYLARTIDADSTDHYMLRKLGKVGIDPSQIFAFVKSLEYEIYSGSLRGTRATLYGSAGNSVDKASLLIAMLRAAGYQLGIVMDDSIL